MTDYTPVASDGERAAAWAIEALREGRYDLGAAIARIAAQAIRLEQNTGHPIVATVPMPTPDTDGPRHLQAVPNPGPTWQQAVDEWHRGVVPAPSEPQVVPPVVGFQVQEAREYWPADVAQPEPIRPPMPTVAPPPTRKCVVQVVRDGVNDVCGLVAYWSVEDERWRHVHGDDESGAGHVPIVPAQQ